MGWRSSIWALLVVAVTACDARLPEPDSPGARLYGERCSGCHRLYGPQLMKPEMWRLTVKRMQGEMARRGVAPLDESETALLLSYLERHSGG